MEQVEDAGDFTDFSTTGLQEYLTRRGVMKMGDRTELIAKCIVVWELKVPIVESKEKLMNTLATEYDFFLKKKQC